MSAETDVLSGTPCASCGKPLHGRFCSACGEKAWSGHDLQTGHLFHDFWHEVTHLDGRIWRSFQTLLLKPGQLTKDYWAGRTGLWLRPLRIFLIVTALSLLLAPDAAGPLGMRTFATQGANGTDLVVGQRPQNSARSAAKAGRVLEGAELAELNAKIFKYYKIMQYLGLATFAGMAFLLLRRIQPHYGGYLIFSLHFYSFEYIVTGVADRLHWNPAVGQLTGVVYLSIALWKLAGGGRTVERAYGVDWRSVLRAALLIVVVALSELLVMAAAGWLALKL